MTTDDAGGDYRPRAATPADTPAILELLQAAFPRWPEVELTGTALEHLEWKVGSPWHRPGMHSVLESQGELVAVALRWTAPAVINGAPNAISQTCDVAVHPSQQGRGLGRVIDTYDRREAVEVGDIGEDLVSGSAAIRHLWEDVPTVKKDVRTWMRPLGFRGRLEHLLRDARRRPGSTLRNAVSSLRSTPNRRPPGVRIEELRAFDARADALWAEVAPRFDFARVRDATYLNWRHADPRSGARTILAASSGDRLLAWAVLRPHEDSLRLVDFLVDPAQEDAGLALLEHCARRAASAGAGSLLTWLPAGHPTEALHEAAGFGPVGEPSICQIWPKESRNAPWSLVEPLDTPDAVVHLAMADFDYN